jgi:hypothetical protein
VNNPPKNAEEIGRSAEEEMTRVARLEQASAKKRHNDQQGDSGSFEDGVGDGTPSRGC